MTETRLELTGSVLESDWDDTSEDFRLAVTAGAFAEKLRDSQYADDVSYDHMAEEAADLRGHSEEAEELAELIRAMDRLD